MRHGYQTVQIDPADIIGRQYNGMISRQLLNRFHVHIAHIFQVIQIFHPAILQHFDKLQHDLCRTCCIIYRPVMMSQHDAKRFRHGI